MRGAFRRFISFFFYTPFQNNISRHYIVTFICDAIFRASFQLFNVNSKNCFWLHAKPLMSGSALHLSQKKAISVLFNLLMDDSKRQNFSPILSKHADMNLHSWHIFCPSKVYSRRRFLLGAIYKFPIQIHPSFGTKPCNCMPHRPSRTTRTQYYFSCLHRFQRKYKSEDTFWMSLVVHWHNNTSQCSNSQPTGVLIWLVEYCIYNFLCSYYFYIISIE